jgi:hypothetical protein
VVALIYWDLIPAALAHSTLGDVKSLMRLGEYCAEAFSLDRPGEAEFDLSAYRRDARKNAAEVALRQVDWSRAARNPRDCVFAFALEQFAKGGCGLHRMAAWLSPLPGARRAELVLSVWPGSAASAASIVIPLLRTKVDRRWITFMSELPRGPYGGLDAFVELGGFFDDPRCAAAALLAGNWPEMVTLACEDPAPPPWRRAICADVECDCAHRGVRCGAWVSELAAALSDPADVTRVAGCLLGGAPFGDGTVLDLHAHRRTRDVFRLLGPEQTEEAVRIALRMFNHALRLPPLAMLRNLLMARLTLRMGGNYVASMRAFAACMGVPGIRAAARLTRTLESLPGDDRMRMHGALMVHLNRQIALRRTAVAYLARQKR